MHAPPFCTNPTLGGRRDSLEWLVDEDEAFRDELFDPPRNVSTKVEAGLSPAEIHPDEIKGISGSERFTPSTGCEPSEGINREFENALMGSGETCGSGLPEPIVFSVVFRMG